MRALSFNRVSVTKFLAAIYISMLIILAIAGFYQWVYFRKTDREGEKIFESAILKLDLLVKMRKGSDYVQVLVLRHTISSDKDAMKKDSILLLSEIQKNDQSIAQYEKLIESPQERYLFDKMKLARQINAAIRDALLDLSSSRVEIKGKKIPSYFARQNETYERFQHANSELSDYVKRDGDKKMSFLIQERSGKESFQNLITIIIAMIMLLLGLIILRTLKKMRLLLSSLAASEKRFRILLENTDELINKCDKNGRLIFANKAFLEKMKYKNAELSQLTIADILSEESKSHYDPEPTPVKYGSKIVNASRVYLAKTGEKICVEGNIVLEYKEGIFEGAEAFFRDVTEKRRLHDELVASEERYRDLFNFSPLPMWYIDMDTRRFLEVNNAAIAHYGYSREEFLKMSIYDYRPAEDVETIREILKNSKSKGFQFTGLTRHIKKSGELIDVEVHCRTIQLGARDVLFAIATDITEKLRVEKEITKAIIKTQEEERFEMGAELHDNVCQILVSSMIYLGMVKEGVVLPQAAEALEEVRKINSLALIEIRNLSHRMAPASLDEKSLYEAINDLLNNFNPDQKWKIHFRYDENIRFSQANADIKLNLYRILQEQLKNTLKYAHATMIDISLQKSDDWIRMRTFDNGAGFDTQTVKKGIGLRNMKRRTELFNGNFKINSSPGRGTEIILEIPLLTD